MNIILCVLNRCGKLCRLLLRHIDNVKGKPLRRFAPDSRKF